MSRYSQENKEYIRAGVLLALFWFCRWMDVRGISLFFISPGKSFVRFLSGISLILLILMVFSNIIRIAIKVRHGPSGESKMLIAFVRSLTGIAIMLAIVDSAGKLTAFSAIGATFIGLLLGWSLQSPVSGIAAWVLVTLRRPFRIGDRIGLPSLGLVGDVTEMGIMYIVLDQVGGAVGSEEAINRSILIPNAMLFSQVVINYTAKQEEPFFLDEVVVRITFNSDWEIAEKILLETAVIVTADIIKKTGIKPYIRSDMYDYGVYMRLRYMTNVTERAMICHEISKRVFIEFQKNPAVDFAIPYLYSSRQGATPKPKNGKGEY